MTIAHRTKARQFALQLIYQMHASEGNNLSVTLDELPRILDEFWQGVSEVIPEDVRLFCENLVRGVLVHHQAIDQRIEKHAEHWKLSRMARVDLSALRLSTYEILFCPDIPLEVVINEGVELAKRFSTKEASSFVNGILDSIGPERQVPVEEAVS